MMRNKKLLLLFVLVVSASASAEYTQTLTLSPGWNAVYLEVVPENNEIDVLLGGLPIQSVWRFLSLEGVTGLPANPSDGLSSLTGWHAYFPAGSAARVLTDLFTLRANNAYLINLSGSSPVTITLTGTPQVQNRRWAPDAFTLTGFGVDPDAPPTFGTYFASSQAHANQPIYTLDGNGVWRLVDSTERIRSGSAYWVFTRGPTRFNGPLEVRLDPGFGDLDFGAEISDAGVTIINRALVPQQILLTRAAGGLDIPLVYEDRSDAQASIDPWLDLDTVFPLLLDAGRGTRINIAPRRADLQFNRAEQVLQFTSLDGARVLIPAAADLPVFDAARAVGRAASIPRGAASSPRAGLWVGTATINAVNQTQSIDGSVMNEDLAPAAQEFPLRVLLHIDAQDQFTLLSQVVQLFEEGSSQNVMVDVPGGEPRMEQKACVPGRSVLITRDELFSNYSGLSLRGDGFVGHRMSTVAYNFGEIMDDNRERKLYAQPMSFDNGRYETDIRLPAGSASNPFFHRFHPDLDNRDEFYEPYSEPDEVPEISRTVAIFLCDTPGTFLNGESWNPAGDPACDPQTNPAAGTSLLAGKFEDRIGGLHKNAVRARGDLQLRRMTIENQLNPDPLDLETCTCDDQGVCP